MPTTSFSSRVEAALAAVEQGVEPEKVVRELSWKEMEELVSAGCSRAGFKCVRDLRLSFGGKRIQADVVAATPSLCLVIDCKRWRKSLSGQVLSTTVIKSVERTKIVADFLGSQYPGECLVFFAPLMISLYEPDKRIVAGVFVLSVNALTGLLRNSENLLAGTTIVKKLSPRWLGFFESYNLNQSRLKKV
ncbi:MAG: hypothetical protein QXU87_01225 [Candidatus Caldarchaeum sp.]